MSEKERLEQEENVEVVELDDQDLEEASGGAKEDELDIFCPNTYCA